LLNQLGDANDAGERKQIIDAIRDLQRRADELRARDGR